MTASPAEAIADNARIVVAVVLVASAVAAAGVPMVERSTSLDQFQADAEEADALDYAEANFSVGDGDTTSAQAVVRDEDVLDRETLVAMLEYERALRANETVAGTLVENESVRSVADLLATTAIRRERRADLRTRRSDLDATSAALDEAVASLARDPNASVRSAFEAIDANSSATLTADDYDRFAASVERRRAAANGSARRADRSAEPVNRSTGQVDRSAERSNRTAVRANRTVGDRVLRAEYANLSADRAALRTLDPALDEKLDALRELNDSEIDALAADALAGDTSRSATALAFMPDYYEPGSADVNATLLVVTQETPGGSFAPGDAPAAIEDSQAAMAALAPDGEAASVLIYGDGVVSAEIADSMVDSVLLVGPLAVAFVLLVLVVVYRDPLDVLLGLVGVGLVLAWTFGVMGWFGVAFSQPFVVVLVLLIGLSIDYGLHVVMRFREARETADTPPRRAMAAALGSVGVALVYVTATTVIGFLSNLASPLGVFRDLGVVSAVGIVAALLVFGAFVPALKVELDAFLEARGVDRVKPAVGTGRGPVNRVLDAGATVAARAPAAVVVAALLVSAAGAYAATDVGASFEQSDFLAEDPADWLKDLPEPVAPGTYTAGTAIDVLDADFVRRDTTATVLVRGDVTDPATLDRLDAARANASDLSATETYANGEAAITDPLGVIERVADRNESFEATLAAADTDGDGVPDRNVTAVFDHLYRVAPDDAGTVVHRADGEYRALRLVVTVDGDVADETVTEQLGWIAADVEGAGTDPERAGVDAVATGDLIVNGITADQLAETAARGLVVALLAVLVVLAVAYRVTEGSASLGVVTVLPVAFTLTWVLGSMALLDVPFNIVTGMITGLTIGLGVDYGLHVSERFAQELGAGDGIDDALHETVTGTGGALLSSAATTAGGFAVLLVAILPFLQSFGLITALTIGFAFLASVFVLPSLLAIWARFVGRGTPATARDDRGTSADDREGRGSPADDRRSGDALANGPDRSDAADVAATRSIERPHVLPDQSVPVTVSVRGAAGRVALREDPPGEATLDAVDPNPVAASGGDGSLDVLWDLGDRSVPATVSYTVDLAGDRRDGDEVAFEGVLERADDARAVRGDETAVVVGDVFQRVLERGEVADADLEAALTDEELSRTEIDRLRRAWLRSD